ncbi:hypothetical protein BC828DRAFT_384795 [Blastocladiella britannica]|nr:hypothetical protein BC828DRAFT_384795 [Blastocladiella britannica]
MSFSSSLMLQRRQRKRIQWPVAVVADHLHQPLDDRAQRTRRRRDRARGTGPQVRLQSPGAPWRALGPPTHGPAHRAAASPASPVERPEREDGTHHRLYLRRLLWAGGVKCPATAKPEVGGGSWEMAALEEHAAELGPALVGPLDSWSSARWRLLWAG